MPAGGVRSFVDGGTKAVVVVRGSASVDESWAKGTEAKVSISISALRCL